MLGDRGLLQETAWYLFLTQTKTLQGALLDLKLNPVRSKRVPYSLLQETSAPKPLMLSISIDIDILSEK